MALWRLPALTPYFSSNPLFTHIYGLIARSRVMTSYLLCSKGGEDYVLIKDGFLYAPLDW
jgi:hypothetical protein